MKKLLISDYDGTLFKDKYELYKNIESIREFIDNGNLFGIATGRTYNSIKNETKLHNIPYDYLICNNGTTIFNKDDDLLYYNHINFSDVIKIVNLINKTIRSPLNYRDIYGNSTENFAEVAEAITYGRNIGLEDILHLKKLLNPLQVISFDTKNNRFVVIKNYSDKKDAIKIVASMENISKNNIYTIGNDFNDKGMIECYNGYKIYGSTESLNVDAPYSESVLKLIKKIG